jgi:6-phosphogluconolactonase
VFQRDFIEVSERFHWALGGIACYLSSSPTILSGEIGPKLEHHKGVTMENIVRVHLTSWVRLQRKWPQLLSWMLLALISTSFLFAQNSDFAYVADLDANAILLYYVDASTGALTPHGSFPATTPIGIAVTAPAKFAFVLNYVQQGSISAFSIDPGTGALTPVVGSPFPAGAYPYRLTIAPSGRFIYAANTASDDISGFSIDQNTGTLTPVPGSPFPAGTTPYMVAISPLDQFAYVANANSDTISAFTVDPNTGALTPVPGSPFADTGQSQDVTGPGASPQGVAVSPSGHFAYVANGHSWTISVYSIDPLTGALTPTAGSPFPSAPSPHQITFTASGQFAYVTNGGTPLSRPDGAVSVYSVNSATGALTSISGSPFPSGAATTSFALDTSAGLAYTANYYSKTISAFSVDSSSGALMPIAGSPFAIGSGPYSIAIVSGYSATVQQPINSDGSSVFNASRGVVPVKFTLAYDGASSCQLPPATISLFRTGGGATGPIDESVYLVAADNGSNFRITSCQYVYNLGSSSLGAGSYQVYISINGAAAGSATFGLR